MAAWVAPAIAGAVSLAGMAIAKGKDKRQLRQQEKLMNLEISGQKQLMDYGMGLQHEMWKQTGPTGQVEELTKAGLNPALIYGMGGAGGQTTGSPGGNVTGGKAPAGSGAEQEALLGMGMQLALMGAQKENIEADTNLKEVEANKKGGVDTQLAQTEIQNLTQGIENQKAIAELTRVQTKVADIDRYIKDRSKEDQIEIIMWKAGEALEILDNLDRENIVNAATMNDRIQTVKVELAQKALTNQLIKAQTTTEKGKPAIQVQTIKESEQKIKTLVQQGVQRWSEISIGAQNANTNQTKMEQDNWVNDVSHSLGLPIDVVEKVAQAIIFKNIISPDKGHNPVQGFRK